MRSYEERAKDFIKEVFPYIEYCMLPRDAKEAIQTFNATKHRKVIVSSGIARIALITSDYVVKYDYNPDEVAYVGGCEEEMRLYAIAKEEGFSYLFAEITRYEYCGRYFYIMPRIYGINPDSYYYANDFMTQEEIDWCDEHDLSDLHCNNYGFRKGHVCIIDYACNHCSESSTES